MSSAERDQIVFVGLPAVFPRDNVVKICRAGVSTAAGIAADLISRDDVVSKCDWWPIRVAPVFKNLF
jgi:hypothetical protein